MMDWNTIFLGVVEGMTEFLPVSSTGHLLIAEHWLGNRSEVFNVVIQAGSMLAVTIVYWRRLLGFCHLGQAANRIYVCKLAIAFGTSCVFGLIAKRCGVVLPETLAPVGWAMVIGSFWMMIAEWYAARRADQTTVTWTVAIIVGLAQVVAGIFPGTSRSGATIFAAMLFGTGNRQAATEFAFLVGIPTMYAASVYELYAGQPLRGVHESWIVLLVGFVASGVTAFVTVRWLLIYIQSHRFTLFAIYWLVAGAAILMLLS